MNGVRVNKKMDCTRSNAFHATRMGSGRGRNEKGALLTGGTENATSGSAEAQCKNDESAECEPISIAVLRNIAVVEISLSCNAEQNHINNPSNERRYHAKSGEEGHDDCANTKTEYVEKEAEEKGETCHSCSCSPKTKGKCKVSGWAAQELRLDALRACRMSVLVRLCMVVEFKWLLLFH